MIKWNMTSTKLKELKSEKLYFFNINGESWYYFEAFAEFLGYDNCKHYSGLQNVSQEYKPAYFLTPNRSCIETTSYTKHYIETNKPAGRIITIEEIKSYVIPTLKDKIKNELDL